MNEITAAESLCRALCAEGVEVVFGHPGGAILPVYDALHRQDRIRHVLTRHEQGAAHAADGYARAGREVGVCLATSGPGATNLVTGLATALMDSVPLVAITGQVPLALEGTQAFQETDIVGVARPVTKEAVQVRRSDHVAAAVRQAFELARSGRPGPVLLDLPKCVQKGACEPPRPPDADRRRTPRWTDRDRPVATDGRPEPDDRGTPEADRSASPANRAAELLDRARRPVLLVGRGVVLSGTAAPLRELAATGDLPVATTLLGLDAFPATDPRALGMPGMHGSERANHALQEADLVVGLGARFDDRVTGAVERFAPRATIVHFEIDPSVLGRTVEPDLAVPGDLRETLPRLQEATPRRSRAGWWRRLREWRRAPVPPEECDPAPGALGGRAATQALARRIGASGATVVTDVGQHQMWMAQELGDAEPGTHLTSGGLGTMGYALPAALGASLASPARPTWVVAGDGGFQMTVQELATVVQEERPLRIAVLNNGYLGMVRQWQEHFYEGRYAATRLRGPDLTALARAHGIPARAVERSDALDEALDWVDGASGPALLDLRIRPEENVYPMVPAGAAIDRMIGGRRRTAAP